ncbi:quercetin dioxygenase-like cupin family protein [Microbacterium kyungheense]|uniref:Quercetin dioxygenase-like cupin family protein n=2 Tax=Microbacterium kyungheense TaxID=1263636 RepID=A0A543F0I6_9MICO|nr:quercetin dioxygenase-like cupin family protein [Microbacterium kyungheense]
MPMDSTDLADLIDELTATARDASSGRAARTIRGGHENALRETVIALRAGHELAEHESPHEATLQVLRGRVRLIAGDESWDGVSGDHLTIPPRRHSLAALDDAVVLLTVSNRVP